MGEKRPRVGYTTDTLDYSQRHVGGTALSNRDMKREEGAYRDMEGNAGMDTEGAHDHEGTREHSEEHRLSQSRGHSTSHIHQIGTIRQHPPAYKAYIPNVEDADFAFKRPETSRARSSSHVDSFRHPSALGLVPPPSSSSHGPLSPPSSRGLYNASTSTMHRHREEGETRKRTIENRSGPPSPPTSHDRDIHTNPSHRPRSNLGRNAARSVSPSSYHPHESQEYQFSAPTNPNQSARPSSRRSLSSVSNDTDTDGESSRANEAGQSGSNPNLQRPKRTRVLMTHLQQNRLGILWKQSKFPSTQEREDIAVEVGLTPRQVQVWFQNRRQTFRKQIQQNAIPQGSDPADYSDLQKSPRSRRMSLEAANALASEDRERSFNRIGEMSTPSSSISRIPTVPPLPPIDMIDRGYDMRPATSTPNIVHDPPSPPRHSESDYRPSSAWSRPATAPYRPMTASSSSSYPLSLSPYANSPSFSRRPGMPEKWKTYWDQPKVTSPVPYSPPPTANSMQKSFSAAYLDQKMPDSKRRRHTDDTESKMMESRLAEPISRPVSDGARPSHLPPSLAAIAIHRPLDGRTETPHRSLPSLGLSLGRSVEPSRADIAYWSSRIDTREDGRRSSLGPFERFGRDDGTISMPRPLVKDHKGLLEEKQDAKESMSPGKSTSTSRLPRLSELFK